MNQQRAYSPSHPFVKGIAIQEKINTEKNICDIYFFTKKIH